MRTLENPPQAPNVTRVQTWKRHRGPDRLFVEQVLFGNRVRLGTEDQVYADYCCGNNSEILEVTYNALRHFMATNGDWRQLPKQNVKPLNNDHRCLDQLLTACGIPESQRLALLARHPHDRLDAFDRHGHIVGTRTRRR